MSQTRLTKGKAAERSVAAQDAIAGFEEDIRALDVRLTKEAEALRKEAEKLMAPKNWVKLEVRATTGKGEVFEVIAEEKNGFDHQVWNQMVSNAGRALRDQYGADAKDSRLHQIRWRLRQIPGEYRRAREELNKKIFREKQVVRKMAEFAG